MSRSRLAAGIAVLVVLAAALVLVLLNRDGSDQPAPATVAAASTTPPTTQATPPPTTGGENWLAIMRQLMAYRHSLFTDPRPELLKQIFDTGCPCYSEDARALAELRRRGLHNTGQGIEVRSAKLVGRARDPAKPIVAVEVVSRQLPEAIVNDTGEVVERSPAAAPVKRVFQLIRGADDLWRVYAIFPT
jgi:hypothetical protein